jgi:hypothetical protein
MPCWQLGIGLMCRNIGVGLGFAPEETGCDIQEFLNRCIIEDANGFRLQSSDLSSIEVKI